MNNWWILIWTLFLWCLTQTFKTIKLGQITQPFHWRANRKVCVSIINYLQNPKSYSLFCFRVLLKASLGMIHIDEPLFQNHVTLLINKNECILNNRNPNSNNQEREDYSNIKYQPNFGISHSDSTSNYSEIFDVTCSI